MTLDAFALDAAPAVAAALAAVPAHIGPGKITLQYRNDGLKVSYCSTLSAQQREAMAAVFAEKFAAIGWHFRHYCIPESGTAAASTVFTHPTVASGEFDTRALRRGVRGVAAAAEELAARFGGAESAAQAGGSLRCDQVAAVVAMLSALGHEGASALRSAHVGAGVGHEESCGYESRDDADPATLRSRLAAGQDELDRRRRAAAQQDHHLRELRDGIARADLQEALAEGGAAGVLRWWSSTLGRTRGMDHDQAVRQWLRELHPGLDWQNTGRNGRREPFDFPVHLWAEAGGVEAAAEALDGLASAVRAARDEPAFPRVEVRVMPPRPDRPLLTTRFAEPHVATLSITGNGWQMNGGGCFAEVAGSCLPLLGRAFAMGDRIRRSR
ncbi:hypothetical protein ACIQF6_35760 [Kitasatospora sp. NPDC092948]|uniref:hypothetical protein n=1 Tax=Kitasatospora sp. NPDC092948 TaxID=3364088 RepID=UPI0038281A8C